MIVEGLQNTSTPNNAVNNLLRACKKELQKCIEWKIALIAREQNGLADFIAAMSKTNPRGMQVLGNLPAEANKVFEDDRDGVAAWRNCSIIV